MMLVPYRQEHILPLLDQEINRQHKDAYMGGLALQLENFPGASVFGKADQAMVCGGVIPIWQGRGYVWTMFSENSKNCFVPVFRAMQKFLKLQMVLFPRLEMAVPLGFETGHRRAKLLGFEIETPLAKSYLPGGEDCTVYVMLRKGGA
jgi:hypothetical protein